MEPSIKIISKVKENELPDWALGDTYYNLTVNGKKCFFRYRGEQICMLFLDGLKCRGIDPDNAVFERGQCERLFGIDIDILDDLIIKAIKHFEITSGLSDDAKETWSDILS